MTPLTRDRRAARRHAPVEEHGIVGARIRAGHRVRVVDVSAGGVLVDTAYRLLPGRVVELHVETNTQRLVLRGLVVRCAVLTLRPSAICYRGAIQFEQLLPWLADEDDGYPAPAIEACTDHPCGADATRQVV